MTTHPGRMTQILSGMIRAFAGPERPREIQIAEAVELVLATNPTLEELAEARSAVLDRHHAAADRIPNMGAEGQAWALGDRTKKAEALAIAEERVRADST